MEETLGHCGHSDIFNYKEEKFVENLQRISFNEQEKGSCRLRQEDETTFISYI